MSEETSAVESAVPSGSACMSQPDALRTAHTTAKRLGGNIRCLRQELR